MKLILNDPMPALRLARAEAVNRNFNAIAMENLHRDHAHAEKRAAAMAIVAGAAPGADFQAEADLRCISALDLARLISDKPNNAAARELHRQTVMMKIANASTPGDLETILSQG